MIAPPMASRLSGMKWPVSASRSGQPGAFIAAASRPPARRQAGPGVAITAASGQRISAIAPKVAAATSAHSQGPAGCCRSAAVSSLSAVTITSPAATAPMPRSAPATCGTDW